MEPNRKGIKRSILLSHCEIDLQFVLIVVIFIGKILGKIKVNTIMYLFAIDINS